MILESHVTPDGEQRLLGCLVPASFPTAARTAADVLPKVYTLDQIAAELAGRPLKTAFGRRSVFGGHWIRNQRSHGSCNGFSTALALSRARVARGEPEVILSGADAYSQMNGGRDDGSQLADGMRVCLAGGIAPEEMVGWDQIYPSRISAAAKAARARFRGFEAVAVDSEEELASGLLLGHFAVVAVHVANGFDRLDGDGVDQGGNGPGNHSVGVDDLGINPTSGRLDFDMFNSWDVTWGDGGRCRLQWQKHLRETVKYHRFWLLVSTTDDPSDDNTPPPVKE